LSYIQENFQGPVAWFMMELGYIVLPLSLTLALLTAYSYTRGVFGVMLRKSYFKKILITAPILYLFYMHYYLAFQPR